MSTGERSRTDHQGLDFEALFPQAAETHGASQMAVPFELCTKKVPTFICGGFADIFGVRPR